MPIVTFHGAAQQVTGSCFLVKGKDTTVVVDCGLFQGSHFAAEKNYKPLPFPCEEIDHVLITHAHLDHTGRVPKLCTEGFQGQIYATKPTLDMTRYLWQDALEIMEIEYQETGQLPLYTSKQVKSALNFFQGVEYGKKIKLTNKDYAIFHDAGHILGSAFIELVIDGKRLVFSGDVGNKKPPIIQETANLPDNIDLLVTESTYGDRNHESKQEREEALFSVVDETLQNQGVLMIPAFAIERTQEILYMFNSLVENNKIPTVNIYLDSPLAIEVTSVFQKYPHFYNKQDQLLQKTGDRDLFDFPGLIVSKTRRQSQQINHAPNPKIIIAGSGMMSGGRITFHLERYLPDPRSTLFIVGYQAKGTLGRKIFDGQKTVTIHGRKIPIKAKVQAVGAYSAHADQKKLLEWMKASKNLKHIALTHGDKDTMDIFGQAIADHLDTAVSIPKEGGEIEV